jgi:CDP-diglyceride synthetase
MVGGNARPARSRRAGSIGAAAGAVAGGVLTVVLYTTTGRPDHFVAKAIAVIAIVALFGWFTGSLAGQARSR